MAYIVVDSIDDGSVEGTLRYAVENAAAGDIISLAGRSLLYMTAYLDTALTIDKAVVIDGVTPKELGPDPMNPGGPDVLYDIENTLFPNGNPGFGIQSYETEQAAGLIIQAAASIRGVCFGDNVNSGAAVKVGADGVIFEKCSFVGNNLAVLLAGSATFNDCKFIINGVYATTHNNAIFANASASGKTFTFNRCQFEINGSNAAFSSGIAAINAGANDVVLNDCVFKKYTGFENKTIYDVQTSFGSTSFNNILTLTGVTSLNNGYNTDYAYIEANGYGGISDIVSSANTIKARGTGALAVPSSVTFADFANTLTRCVYGAGASRFVTDGSSLSWSSTDATKTVMLLTKNGSSWDITNAAASSPVSSVSAGTYAIFDGETFRTRTVTTAPRNLVVMNTNDSGEGSLRAAIAEANADDTITFDSTLAGGEIVFFSELEIESPVTIVGPVTQDGAPNITLIGLHLWLLKSRPFSVKYYETGADDFCRGIYATDSFTISNVIFTAFKYNSGYEKYGGVIFCDYQNAPSAVATLVNCKICNVQDEYGYDFPSGVVDAGGGRWGGASLYSGVPKNYFPDYPDDFIPGNGGYIAVTGGAAAFTDCAFLSSLDLRCYNDVFGEIIAAFNATITITRCLFDCLGVDHYLKPLYFKNCAVTVSDVSYYDADDYSEASALMCDGGTLTLNNVNTRWLIAVSEFDAPPTITGYCTIGVIYGEIDEVTGTGALGSINVEPLTMNNVTPLLVPTVSDGSSSDIYVSDLAADETEITYNSSGAVLIEKQVTNGWQKVGVTQYQDAGADDESKRPVGYDSIPTLGTVEIDPVTGEMVYPQYFIPDPNWQEIPDPRVPEDPTALIKDPTAPYIPNNILPQPTGTFPDAGPTTYTIETTETTTYRVWDGVLFFTTTVTVEEPEPPEPPTPPEPVAVRPGRLVRAQLQMAYENEGESAIPAGTPIQIGSAFGVAEVAIPAGATGVISILGTWIFPCADTTVASVGDVACWDDTNKVITTAPSGSSVETPDVLPVGAFVNAVSSGETTATVMIYPAAPVNGERSSSEESGSGD